jgi:ribosomal-protein-alanine N-acetyltransferase
MTVGDRFERFPTFPELRTERLVLRELTAADAPWYLVHFSRPGIVTGQGFPAPANLDVAMAELRAYVLDLFEHRNGFRWGLRNREAPDLIGSAGLYRWVDEPVSQAEVGYDLDPAWWGRGLMAEALRAIHAFAFESMRIERIEAFVLATNDRSIRLLEHLGYVREALLADHGEDEHGVLRDEWRLAFTRRSGVGSEPSG